MRGFILFLALLAGCQWDTRERLRQNEAVAIIWYQTYEETHDPPGIDWIKPRRSDLAWCNDWSFWNGARCMEGFYDLSYVHVVVDDKYGDGIPLDTLAHEMYHAHMFLTTGNVDALHKDAGWTTAVIQARFNLLDADMKDWPKLD